MARELVLDNAECVHVPNVAAVHISAISKKCADLPKEEVHLSPPQEREK